MKVKKIKKGFTLIEVIIVITIIGLLGLLVYMNVKNNINKANDARRKSDLQRIVTAFEEYYSDNDCYPPSGILSNCGGNDLSPYLDSIPCDPVYGEPYCYLPTEPNVAECYQKYRVLNTLKYLSDPVIKSSFCDSETYCGWETECTASGDRSGFNYGFSSLNTTLINPDVVIPTPPPGEPTPGTEGNWACTPQGNCDNYGNGDPRCTYFFINDNCDNMCIYPVYQCTD